MAKEHDPRDCSVCAELGDFITQTDTAEWLEEHRRFGLPVAIEHRGDTSVVVEPASA